MNINFDLYKIFYYVSEFKSITKTANYMHISQPAVTRHIKNLESIVGNDLIAKVPKGIELTDEGKKLYEIIKKPAEELINIELKESKVKDLDLQ
ncbi:MAG: LysR family transcriptional regulator [Bacilli bacterium]|nr:LysR family transcriptional regulator [Bacilli bacterium]